MWSLHHASAEHSAAGQPWPQHENFVLKVEAASPKRPDPFVEAGFSGGSFPIANTDDAPDFYTPMHRAQTSHFPNNLLLDNPDGSRGAVPTAAAVAVPIATPHAVAVEAPHFAAVVTPRVTAVETSTAVKHHKPAPTPVPRPPAPRCQPTRRIVERAEWTLVEIRRFFGALEEHCATRDFELIADAIGTNKNVPQVRLTPATTLQLPEECAQAPDQERPRGHCRSRTSTTSA